MSFRDVLLAIPDIPPPPVPPIDFPLLTVDALTVTDSITTGTDPVELNGTFDLANTTFLPDEVIAPLTSAAPAFWLLVPGAGGAPPTIRLKKSGSVVTAYIYFAADRQGAGVLPLTSLAVQAVGDFARFFDFEVTTPQQTDLPSETVLLTTFATLDMWVCPMRITYNSATTTLTLNFSGMNILTQLNTVPAGTSLQTMSGRSAMMTWQLSPQP